MRCENELWLHSEPRSEGEVTGLRSTASGNASSTRNPWHQTGGRGLAALESEGHLYSSHKDPGPGLTPATSHQEPATPGTSARQVAAWPHRPLWFQEPLCSALNTPRFNPVFSPCCRNVRLYR